MSDKDFKWTDELVAEIVGQAHRDGYHQSPAHIYDRLQEFKQSKQPKEDKDWEIVQWKFGDCIVRPPDVNNPILPKGMNGAIHSVRRLSDGEVFSVGDRVNWKDHGSADFEYTCGVAVISEIRKAAFPQGSKELVFELRDDNGEHAAHKFISNIKHAKKKPLFTTEDGVEIFEDGECWIVEVFNDRISNRAIHWTEIVKSGMKEHERYFSTEAIASEWILLNKPCLSLNDIKFWLEKYFDYPGGVSIEQIKELAKTKINAK